MNKKKAVYLKIEDWDSLRSIVLASLTGCSESGNRLMEIMSELGRHEFDVIELEAKNEAGDKLQTLVINKEDK